MSNTTRQFIQVPTIGLVQANIVRADSISIRPPADGTQGFYYGTDSGALYADINGVWVTLATSGGTGYITIEDEGTGLPSRQTVNFTGTGVTATDNPGLLRTDVSIDAGVLDPGANGILVRTGLNTTVARAIGGVAPIVVTNGNGVAGDPIISFSGSVIPPDDTSIQKVKVADGGTVVSTRDQINFETDCNIDVDVTDDAVNNRANVTIGTSLDLSILELKMMLRSLLADYVMNTGSIPDGLEEEWGSALMEMQE